MTVGSRAVDTILRAVLRAVVFPALGAVSVVSLTVTALSVTALFAAVMSVAAPAVGAQARKSAVHTDTMWAQSLGVRKALTVYLPPSYATSPDRRYPVLVYLHGLTGNERNWVDNGLLDRSLDSLAAAGRGEAIVVMPDGDDGWYTTWNILAASPPCGSDTVRKEPAATYCVPWTHYDDYVAHDVVGYVDSHYRTLGDRVHRGIAGLSMGGYGAVSLALAYPQVFGAAASHSGVLSPRFLGPRPFAPPGRYAMDTAQMKTATGGLWTSMAPAFGRDTIAWIARDPGHLAVRAVQRQRADGMPLPALRVDCGVADPYIDQSRDFHATLDRLGVSHQYAEWPGKHDWAYWRVHSVESLVFLLRLTAP